MKKYGTTVKNPCARVGTSGYKCCRHCDKLFTALGLSRHWDKCADNPKNRVKS